MMLRFFLAALILCAGLLGPATGLHAQTAETPETAEALSAFESTVARVEQVLSAEDLEQDELESLSAALEDARTRIAPIRAAASGRLATLREQLAPLGEAPDEGAAAEPPDVAAERARLTGAIAAEDSVLKQIGFTQARAQTLAEQITDRRREVFARRLMTRGISPLAPDIMRRTAEDLTAAVTTVASETRDRARIAGFVGKLADRLALPAVLAMLGLVVAVVARRWTVSRLVGWAASVETAGARVGIAVMLTMARLLMPAAAVAMLAVAAANSGLLGPTGEAALRGLNVMLLCLIGAYALGGAYFAPRAAPVRLARTDDRGARRAHRWLIILSVLVGLDRMLVAGAAGLGLSVEAQIGLNAGLITLAGIALWGFLRTAHPGNAAARGKLDTEPDAAGAESDPEAEKEPPFLPRLTRALFFVLRAAAVVGPLLALAGFYGASRFAFYPVIFSAAVIGVCVLLYIVVSAAVDAAVLSPAPQDRPDRRERLRLIPVIVAFLLGCAALPILALIWGANTTDLAALWREAVAGFRVGDITISPLDFVAFVIVFSIGYMLTRLAQGLLARSVLPLTSLDSGGRSAILAGVGYTGIILSALAAVSSTELDLTNLAIVAGALSVGIGFGLQNIVNNFVSGVILLIERPIKQGDWVEIGGIHGTVQKVNVRSTEIQTFDRSTMFVPNADLISGTVTNWTHGNMNGRIIVDVGVAYGTDARLVEKILLEVAQGHPMLLRRPAPYVLFHGFGADSLDFQIRGVLSDVNWILNVGSDLRYSIYERFAEEGIEIPFAQRDLHIRDIEKLGAILRSPQSAGQDARDGDDGQPSVRFDKPEGA